MKYNVKKAFTGKKNQKRYRTAKKTVKTAGKIYGKTMKYASAINAAATLASAGMRLMNIEKKRIDNKITAPLSFAKFNNFAVAPTASGAFTRDITPVISEGITGSTRNGLSVKLVSACMDIQINQSASTVNAFKYKYYIVCRPDSTVFQTAIDVFNNMFEVNPFSGVRDYHSNRDPETFHQVRIIKQGRGQLSQDQITSAVGYNQWKIPLKLNLHQKYQTDATTTTSKNQLFLIILADTGDQTLNSGAQILFNMRYYYVDN